MTGISSFQSIDSPWVHPIGSAISCAIASRWLPLAPVQSAAVGFMMGSAPALFHQNERLNKIVMTVVTLACFYFAATSPFGASLLGRVGISLSSSSCKTLALASFASELFLAVFTDESSKKPPEKNPTPTTTSQKPVTQHSPVTPLQSPDAPPTNQKKQPAPIPDLSPPPPRPEDSHKVRADNYIYLLIGDYANMTTKDASYYGNNLDKWETVLADSIKNANDGELRYLFHNFEIERARLQAHLTNHAVYEKTILTITQLFEDKGLYQLPKTVEDVNQAPEHVIHYFSLKKNLPTDNAAREAFNARAKQLET